MYKKDWVEKLNGFLKLNDRDILTNAGSISHELGKIKHGKKERIENCKRPDESKG